MKVLDLFCGHKSVTNWCEGRGMDVVSVDICEKYRPTLCCDILDFPLSAYGVGHFDVIWASPECKVFSQLQHTNIGRNWANKGELEEARRENGKFILKAIEIIEHLKPRFYFIENPRYSAIWQVEGIPESYLRGYVDVDYCRFGYEYRKRTRVLTNKALPHCLCPRKKHDTNIGFRGVLTKSRGYGNDQSQEKRRYSIPPKLIEYLFESNASC